jgi:hypothetical protein
VQVVMECPESHRRRLRDGSGIFFHAVHHLSLRGPILLGAVILDGQQVGDRICSKHSGAALTKH